MPTRTDQIVRAVHDEAEKRRAVLDGPDPPQYVRVVVYLSKTEGRPIRVMFEPNWHRDIPPNGR